MTCQLHWTINPTVSCFHAVEILFRGWPLADAALNSALATAVTTLRGVMATDHIDPLVFTEHLVPLSNGGEGNLELARSVVTKIAGREFAEKRYRRYSDLLEPMLAAWRLELPRLDER